MSRKATKWNGIRTVLEQIGLSPDDAVYFGDDEDDLESLSQCGQGIAVANAIDKAKTAADRITASNDEDGAARYIEKYLL